MTPIHRHERVALHFSGGKDSLACLHIVRPWLDRVTVFWLNSGALLPEMVDRVRAIGAGLPHFVEIAGDQPARVAEFGWPTEILPITNTAYGRAVDGHDRPMMQSYLDCCAASLWAPMQRAMQEFGATLIIRGQRLDDARKSTVRSGAVIGPVEFWFPIEDWSADDVRLYLDHNGIECPPHYVDVDSSFDCMDCTAYLDEAPGRLRYLRRHHPETADVVASRLAVIRSAAVAEITKLEAVANE